MQYSESKDCSSNLDDDGMFKIASIEDGVFEITIFSTFSQGINAEEVNKLSGIVSEKTTPFIEGDTL